MSALATMAGEVLALVRDGGWVMLPLVVFAVVLWWALGWRAVTLLRGTAKGVAPLVDAHRHGRGPRHGVLGRAAAIAVAVEREGRAHPRGHLDDRLMGLEAEIGRFDLLVRSLVVVAPLTGLLGTVAGMIETFEALGDMSLFSQSGGIAGGISQALLTTQMGLAVAIPGLVVGRMLRRRQDLLATDIERIKDLVCAGATAGGTR